MSELTRYSFVAPRATASTAWVQESPAGEYCKHEDAAAEIAALKADLKLNAQMLAKQTNLAREAETESMRLSAEKAVLVEKMVKAADLLDKMVKECREGYSFDRTKIEATELADAIRALAPSGEKEKET